MAPSREDYVHRALCMQPPSWRLPKVKFRTDGILLPFGSPREEFDTPNPTFFQSGGWLMFDSSVPLGGWDLKTVVQNALPAKHDLYGALFFHLRDIILNFCLHFTTLNVHITLLHISKICDRGYLGVETCLSIFSPLLKSKEDNPHATLLALFMNDVEKEGNAADYLTGRRESITRATSYIPGCAQAVGSRNQYSPASLKIMQTVAAFRNFDAMFKRFMLNTRSAELTRAYRLQARENHTIVSPWPARLKDTPTQSEFELFHGAEQSGTESKLRPMGLVTAAAVGPARAGNDDGRRSRSGSSCSTAHKRSVSAALLSKLTSIRMNQPSDDAGVENGGEEISPQNENHGPLTGRNLPDGKAGGGKSMATALQHQIRTRRRKGSLRKTALLGTGVLKMSQKGLSSRAQEISRDDGGRNTSPGKEPASDDLSRLPGVLLAPRRDDATTSSQASNMQTPVTPRPPTPPVRPLPQSTWSSRPVQRAEQQQKRTDDFTKHHSPEHQKTADTVHDDGTTDDEDLISFPPLENTLSRLSSRTSTSSISAISLLPARRLPLAIPTPSSSSESYFPPPRSTDPGIMSQPRQRAPSQRIRSPLATAPAELSSDTEGWDYSETEWWGWIILIVTWVVFVVGMGSCFDVWSWAWDVGETPYAPPELEDDPTLPIVGYYPALITLTAVMAWVWVVVAWMGMKYFRHANISGEDV
ncbi:hypothetical protein LOZ33_001859 [Ophidiomyces ophidiicola]|nr:hypothetical protein LOZ33_001859 [Ophidiomyces ophidiicola]KAI2333172.1 hypothetical protein LOY96_003641 [Ophidiomyces ophidiicola]